MPRRLPLLRRITTATRWPVGMAITSWHYLWRTTPMRRTEERGFLPADAPPRLPDGVEREAQQRVDDGVGALFHRLYRVCIADSSQTSEQLMAQVQGDLNAAAPTELAVFHKLRGAEGRMQVGDEYLVRMPGPWDGPVRTVEVTPTSFRFLTLERHLEAGQIEFRARREGELVFELESWARNGSRLSELLYDHLRMSKEIQLHMWASLLERVVRLANGRRAGLLEIHTWRVESDDVNRSLDARTRRELAELRDRRTNFDADRIDEYATADGWHLDRYCQPLPAEAPGEPVPGGSWETAQRLMLDYRFADPDIVRAVYSREQPFERRDLLLQVRFHGLRFRIGVRVGGLQDATRTVAGRDVRVWGWHYRTLEGHLEMGQMSYELWKWIDDGAVEFRIYVISRPSRTGNPLVRAGFHVFGRREQQRFARNACTRMAQLTAAQLTAREFRRPG